MNCVRTVLGDVDAGVMGFTYTHEHVCCNPYTAEKDPTLAITDIEGSNKRTSPVCRSRRVCYCGGNGCRLRKRPAKACLCKQAERSASDCHRRILSV